MLVQDTIFHKVLDRSIPADIVFENGQALGFKDIQPQAPVHVLFIHKTATRCHLETSDAQIYADVMLAARQYAEQEGLKDYRLVMNNGEKAGQSVFYMHLHLLAGRELNWPPG